MKYIWDKDDIWAGRTFWRKSEITIANIDYVRGICWKIGYCEKCRDPNPPKIGPREWDQTYCIVALLTDGLIYGHGTKSEIADMLNKDGDNAPLSQGTLIKILRTSEEGKLK